MEYNKKKERRECMREFIILDNDANQRVDKFILKMMKTMPKSLMYKYIRNKKIKVNKRRCEISQRLQTGDTMQCYIAEEFFDIAHNQQFLKVPSTLHIVYEDAHLLLVDKPQGLLSHSDRSEIQDNLADRILHYLYEKKEYDPKENQSFTPALCHRIDRNTQGLIIAAKSAAALRFINEKIKKREIKKTYTCIVEGHIENNKDIVCLYHRKLQGNMASIRSTYKEGYRRIETRYRVLELKEKYSFVEVDLITGKGHQIRSVFSYLHHPLYGDVKYGAQKTRDKEYQALCAYRIQFDFKEVEAMFAYLNNKTFCLTNHTLLDKFHAL